MTNSGILTKTPVPIGADAKLAAMNDDERAAFRDICKAYRSPRAGDQTVNVPESRRAAFEALAAVGLIVYHDGQAQLKNDRVDICDELARIYGHG
jgi:hypothetical protein